MIAFLPNLASVCTKTQSLGAVTLGLLLLVSCGKAEKPAIPNELYPNNPGTSVLSGQGFVSQAVAPQTLEPNGIIALKSIYLKVGATVQSNAYVLEECVGDDCAPGGVEMLVGKGVVSGTENTLAGDSVKVKRNAVVQGSLEGRELDIHPSAIVANTDSISALPLLPDFLSGTPGTQNVSNIDQSLPEGQYDDLLVYPGGELVLEGGVYQVSSITIRRSGRLICASSCTLTVKEQYWAGRNTIVKAESELPGDMVIYVEGGDSLNLLAKHNITTRHSGHGRYRPFAAHNGRNSVVYASLYVPNGSLRLRRDTLATGVFIGRKVVIGKGVQVSGTRIAETSKIIAANTGGTIELPGKVSLDVPACALSEDTIISVKQSPAIDAEEAGLPPGFVVGGPTYEFFPNGLQFDCAARMGIGFDPDGFGEAEVNLEELVAFSSSDSGPFELLQNESVDTTNNVIGVDVEHFSAFIVGTVDLTQSVQKMLIKDDIAYAFRHTSKQGKLDVIDARNKLNPVTVKTINFPQANYYYDSILVDDSIYVAAGENRIRISTYVENPADLADFSNVQIAHTQPADLHRSYLVSSLNGKLYYAENFFVGSPSYRKSRVLQVDLINLTTMRTIFRGGTRGYECSAEIIDLAASSEQLVGTVSGGSRRFCSQEDEDDSGFFVWSDTILSDLDAYPMSPFYDEIPPFNRSYLEPIGNQTLQGVGASIYGSNPSFGPSSSDSIFRYDFSLPYLFEEYASSTRIPYLIVNGRTAYTVEGFTYSSVLRVVDLDTATVEHEITHPFTYAPRIAVEGQFLYVFGSISPDRTLVIYDLNPVPATVESLYPTTGSRWNDYVYNDGADILSASGLDCSTQPALTYEDCLHGGEMRVVNIAGLSDCTDVEVFDLLGAFNWVCDDSGPVVRGVSTGLKEGKGLSDLIDFAAGEFRLNRVEVEVASDIYLGTEPAIWWTNPVEKIAPATTLDTTSTIYMADANPARSLTGSAQRLGLVVEPGVTFTGDGVDTSALVSGTVDWVEGDFDGQGINLYGFDGAGRVFRNLTIANVSVGIEASLRNGRAEGIQINNADFGFVRAPQPVLGSLYRNITFTNIVQSAFSYTYVDRSTFHNIRVANTTASNAIILEGDDNKLVNAVVSNSRLRGFLLDGNRWVILNTAINHAFSNGMNLTGLSTSPVLDAVVMNQTTLGNWSSGLLIGNIENSLVESIAGLNQFDGILVSNNSQNNTLADLAGLNNRYGIRLSQTGTNYYTGMMRVGGSLNVDCEVNSSPAGGIDDNTCAPNSGSDHVVTDGLTGAASLEGALAADSVNANGASGQELYDSITDWSSFENHLRGWGHLPGSYFGSTTGWGRCESGESCQIWGLGLQTSDTVLRAVRPEPTNGDAANTRSHAFTTGTVDYLIHTYERMFDGIGNDNGLCETDEACIYAPNIGAYQGHGDLILIGTINGTVVDNVTLYEYELNGY